MKQEEVIKIYINYKINIDNTKEKNYNPNIETFTYEDYIKYQNFLNKKDSTLKEEPDIYILGSSRINKKLIMNMIKYLEKY